MITLAIRTDQPSPTLNLFRDSECIAEDTWLADRQMALSLPMHIDDLCASVGVTKYDMTGIACYLGPGSFTGLRIGISYANTLSYALQIPIVGCVGDNWEQEGLGLLKSGVNHKVCLPEYGAEARITLPKK